MKHLWALLSTLVLSITLVVSGVAAGAAGMPETDASGQARTSSDATVSVVPTVTADGFFWQLTAPQDVVSGAILMARQGAHAGSRGTRSDKQFFEISSTGSNDVPDAALSAYRHAEKVMATTDPGCDISWTLLAAIGRVESNHGRFGGAELGSDGVSRPEIRGPRLDGAGPFAAIRDSDNGTLDRDKLWDRAVGQMQFLPETWRSVARDGDGDGQMNPDDIDDSALGSAVYLCGAGGSLADAAGMSRAAFRYNHSDYYVTLVLSMQAGYQTGVFAVPSPPPPAPKAKKARTKVAKPRHVAKPRTPAAQPAPAAPKPIVPKPTPTPTPAPTGPSLVRVEGTWNVCGLNFCLTGSVLDLGAVGVRGDQAAADFDGDGTVKANAEEFAGLVGRHVNLQVERNAGGLVVYTIGGQGFRNADGSFARTAAASVAAPSASPTTTP
jgi:membrane-bound lytic murein transglycosylase B